ncbi:hypothetical protein CEXT_332241 [Caerostris extrusa]|uniref:Uncharacterized protein n=1 Tax=Caerostris extrusa TaxID=172846 RepID=A0AAV4PZP9_CAEEX|nr:hypothetical protein CEXT_332241 [Caerostris extrusa]
MDRPTACIPDPPVTVPASVTMPAFAALHPTDVLPNSSFMLFVVGGSYASGLQRLTRTTCSISGVSGRDSANKNSVALTMEQKVQ